MLVLGAITIWAAYFQQCIHNGFGLHFFGRPTGPEYAGRFIAELKKTDIEVLTDTMVLEVSNERVVTAMCARPAGAADAYGGRGRAGHGLRERTRGALNIPGTRPAGVYTTRAAHSACAIWKGICPAAR